MKFLIPYHIRVAIDKAVSHYNNKEFTLYGKSRIVEGYVYLVDFKVPNQKSSGAYTEVDSDAKEEFTNRLIESGENLADWNIWIHSHNTMGLIWSTTDEEDMWEYNNGQADHFFHILLSTKGWKGAVTTFKPFKISALDIPVEFCEASTEGLSQEEKNNLKEVVKIEKMITDFKKLIEEAVKEKENMQETIKDLEEEKLVLQSLDSTLAVQLKDELLERNGTFASVASDSYGSTGQRDGSEFNIGFQEPLIEMPRSSRKQKRLRKKLRRYRKGLLKEIKALKKENGIPAHTDCACQNCLRINELEERYLEALPDTVELKDLDKDEMEFYERFGSYPDYLES